MKTPKQFVIEKYKIERELYLHNQVDSDSFTLNDLINVVEEYASQQKPEIAWLPDWRIKELSENLNFRINDAFHNEGMSTNGVISEFLKEVQSELKTRIQPSDKVTIKSDNSKVNANLLEEVELYKYTLKKAREFVGAEIGESIEYKFSDVQKEVERLKDALREAKKDMEWMWENLPKPHTSDHFNIPANAINSIEEILNQK